MDSKFLPLPCMLCPAAAPSIFSLCRQNPLFYPRTLSFRHTPSRRRSFFTLSTAASDATSNSTTAAGDEGEEDSTSIDTNNRRTSGSISSKQTSSTLNIRYRSRSKNRARQLREEEEGEGNNTNQLQPGQPLPPKSWEEMTLGEKAVELYMGDKGVLFWLNKFAYASIFIVIGGWILFRFVGPTLNLYQLDGPPLSPSDVLKGSSPP